jgi:hypothetical protein
MGVEHNMAFPGVDGAEELLSASMDSNDEDQMIFLTSREAVTDLIWASAVTSKYKLVFSVSDVPWLFDRTNDPSELINYHSNVTYTDVVAEMQEKLLAAIEEYDFPLFKHSFLLKTPDCHDSPDVFYKGVKQNPKDCNQINFKKKNWCRNSDIASHCPIKCDSCFDDSLGTMWFNDGVGEKDCSFVKENMEYCDLSSVQSFCLLTCDSSNSANDL